MITLKSLLANAVDKTYLADLIGIVTGISEIVSIDIKGRPTFKRTLRLTDTRETATVVLWSQNAEAVDQQAWIDISSREHVVALIMGCTYRKQNSLGLKYALMVKFLKLLHCVTGLLDRLIRSNSWWREGVVSNLIRSTLLLWLSWSG